LEPTYEDLMSSMIPTDFNNYFSLK